MKTATGIPLRDIDALAGGRVVPGAAFGAREMAAILANLPDPVFVLTRSGRYAAILGGTDSRYYHDGSSLIGQCIADVLTPTKTAWFMQQIEAALASRRLWVVEYSLGGADVLGLGQDGPEGPIWFEGRVCALAEPVAGEDAVLWVASNITARHHLEQQLRHLSETDELSGLSNRRRLMRFLQERFDERARYATPTSVLSFDIDHFKRINDQSGHEAGDQAIRIAAEVCRAALRANDLAARLGGDEFVVVMAHTPLETALRAAHRLAADIAAALSAQPLAEGRRITLSGGVSALLAADRSIDDVLRRADQALYSAKTAGRARVEPCAEG